MLLNIDETLSLGSPHNEELLDPKLFQRTAKVLYSFNFVEKLALIYICIFQVGNQFTTEINPAFQPIPSERALRQHQFNRGFGQQNQGFVSQPQQAQSYGQISQPYQAGAYQGAYTQQQYPQTYVMPPQNNPYTYQ